MAAVVPGAGGVPGGVGVDRPGADEEGVPAGDRGQFPGAGGGGEGAAGAGVERGGEFGGVHLHFGQARGEGVEAPGRAPGQVLPQVPAVGGAGVVGFGEGTEPGGDERGDAVPGARGGGEDQRRVTAEPGAGDDLRRPADDRGRPRGAGFVVCQSHAGTVPSSPLIILAVRRSAGAACAGPGRGVGWPVPDRRRAVFGRWRGSSPAAGPHRWARLRIRSRAVGTVRRGPGAGQGCPGWRRGV